MDLAVPFQEFAKWVGVPEIQTPPPLNVDLNPPAPPQLLAQNSALRRYVLKKNNNEMSCSFSYETNMLAWVH